MISHVNVCCVHPKHAFRKNVVISVTPLALQIVECVGQIKKEMAISGNEPKRKAYVEKLCLTEILVLGYKG